MSLWRQVSQGGMTKEMPPSHLGGEIMSIGSQVGWMTLRVGLVGNGVTWQPDVGLAKPLGVAVGGGIQVGGRFKEMVGTLPGINGNEMDMSLPTSIGETIIRALLTAAVLGCLTLQIPDPITENPNIHMAQGTDLP